MWHPACILAVMVSLSARERTMHCTLYNLLQNPMSLLFPPWMVLDESPRQETGLERSVVKRLTGNDPASVPGMAREFVTRALELQLFDHQASVQLQVALEEALTNAVIHGNLEIPSVLKDADETAFRKAVEERRSQAPFADRVVWIEATYSSDGVTVQIEDEGPGFDPESLPDPSLPENIERGHGRGVAMMRSFMDHVEFEGRGNIVKMSKCRAGASVS